MPELLCARCNQTKAALSEAPLPNDLGEKVLKQSCEVCWQEWVAQQLMIMNEYRLDPMNDEHSLFLDNEMIKFLNLK